jgi:hypothetical protein
VHLRNVSLIHEPDLVSHRQKVQPNTQFTLLFYQFMLRISQPFKQ